MVIKREATIGDFRITRNFISVLSEPSGVLVTPLVNGFPERYEHYSSCEKADERYDTLVKYFITLERLNKLPLKQVS